MLPGILSKVKAVTNLKLVLLARDHNMRKEEGTRKECISYKYNKKASRDQLFGADLTNVKYASKVNTRYVQYNVYLCRKRKCWKRYYNSKKAF
jgi:hypothetical protein